MPEFVLVIIAALIGLLVGYLARGIRSGKGGTTPTSGVITDTPVPETSAQTEIEADPTEVSPAAAGQPIAGTGQPATDPTPSVLPPPSEGFPVIHIAREVLEVADGIENPELARRLVEAVVLLPAVSAVRPSPGDKYQSLLHEWAGNQITDQQDQWYTVAEILAPGAITSEQRLLRPAHVIVFEPPEES